MAKVSRLSRTIWILLALSCVTARTLEASTVSTRLNSVANGLADRISGYATKHNGNAPKSWDDLKPFVDFERAEINLGASFQSTMTLFSGVYPALEGAAGDRIVAITAFPIDEDRRNGIGRYIVYQQTNGDFGARWESEQTIQKALVTARVSIEPAAVYHERLIKPLYPEYGMKLVEDAVKHGVPMEEAAKMIEKHIDDVSNRSAKPATTWAEVAGTAATNQTAPASAQATPVPLSAPSASPAPTPPVAQNSRRDR